MFNKFFPLIIFSILLIHSLQQTTKTIPQAPQNKPLNKPEVPFQKFNDILLRNLEEDEGKQITLEMESKLQKQIIIWTSIGLAFVLYFIVMALIDMPNPKSSILYAKYDTTRAEHES